MSYGYYQPYWELNDNELEHFGIKGMKWGIRRYQNADGTLTDSGKKRYSTTGNSWKDKQLNKINKEYDKAYKKLEIAKKERDG